jgi:hypothetical protein
LEHNFSQHCYEVWDLRLDLSFHYNHWDLILGNKRMHIVWTVKRTIWRKISTPPRRQIHRPRRLPRRTRNVNGDVRQNLSLSLTRTTWDFQKSRRKVSFLSSLINSFIVPIPDSDLKFPIFWSEVYFQGKWFPVESMVLNLVAATPKELEQFEPKGKIAEEKKLVMGYVVAYDSGIQLRSTRNVDCRSVCEGCDSAICKEFSGQDETVEGEGICSPRRRWTSCHVRLV